MNDKTKDRWLYPLLTGAIAGLATGIPLMIWGAWYSGVKWHSPFSSYWFRLVFTAPVPIWFAFPLAVLAVFSSWKAYRFRARNSYLEASAKEEGHWQTVAGVLTTQRDRLEEKMAEIQSKEPRLHGVWNQAQTFWHMGRHGEEPSMQIGGWIDLTSSNTEDNLFLLAAYIHGRRANIFMDVTVKPNVVNHQMVMLFLHPPLTTETDRAFEATIVVEDQFNRKYELPKQSFRATPNPLPNPKPGTVLHASWLTTSDWGWVGSNFVDEGFGTYIIRGEVTFLLEQAPGPVHIVGVDIEGAKSLGDFENFDLTPGHTVKRTMKMYFQGKAPESNDYYEPLLVFRDIKGNKYPTKAHKFIPLPIPERVANERRGPGKMIVPFTS